MIVTLLLISTVCGIAGGGLVLRSVLRRRLTLDQRVRPYVAASYRAVAETGASHPSAEPAWVQVFRPLLPSARVWAVTLGRLGSSTASVQNRLQVLHNDTGVERFRLEQLACGALGLAAGLVASIGLMLNYGAPWFAVVVLSFAGGVVGMLARDYWLSRQVGLWRAQVTAQLPDITELLALSVGAGETLGGALNRLEASTTGAINTLLASVAGDIRVGVSVAAALSQAANRVQVPAFTRLTEALVVSLQRGSPLTKVLRDQSADARESFRHALMELGGKKEIAMLVPVVFLILPVTVLFALFPGVVILNFAS